MNFTKMSLAQRIILMAVTLITLQVVSNVVATLNLGTIEHHIQNIDERNIPMTRVITEITEHQLEQEIAIETAIRYALEDKLTGHGADGFKTSVDRFHNLSILVSEEVETAEQLVQSAQDIAETEAYLAQLLELEDQLRIIHTHHDTWEQHADEVLNLLKENELETALQKSELVETEAHELEEEVTHLLHDIENFTAEAVHEVDNEAKALQRSIIILFAISFAISLFITVRAIKTLRHGMSQVNSTTDAIANGDLTQLISDQEPGEIGLILGRLKHMQGKLHATVSMVVSASNEVEQSATELAEVSRNVYGNVQTQQSEVQQAATAMNELEATSREVASNAEQTQQSTSEGLDITQNSRTSMTQSMDSMGSLVSNLKGTSEVLQLLSGNSESVGSVLDVIKGIAEQTNLLALNAAIEAARAGEQGRGFAVVADEVRTLAQRTQESTSEIETMLEEFRAGVLKAVQAMEASEKTGIDTQEISQEASGLVAKLEDMMTHIADMNTQIASASEEQSIVVKEMNTNMDRINESSELNASEMSRIAAASEQLGSTSSQLKKDIHYFTL
jgi:methyl-accepting chemotaxis protein